jgi:predicted nuclease of predicted toxin-antitoxin system
MTQHKKTSSKQSDTNIRKRLEEIVFFIDRCIYSKTLVQALNDYGLNIEIHDNHFENDVEDPVWLFECGQNNWIVLSKDKNIKKNPLERQALFNAGVAAFFLTTGGISAEETAKALIIALKRIANLIQSQQRPFIARINADGEVKLWIDHKGNDHITKKHSKKEKHPNTDQ